LKINLHKSGPSSQPIGVFDSGIGGLTVAHALFDILPDENIIYFGDTARLPYGTKSKETIINYSKEITGFLLKMNVKLIVVACNTASSVAIPALKKITSIPVIGVIKPGSKAAVEKTENNRIGVIGTFGTIESGAYKSQIHRLRKNAKVFQQSCSLFVQLAEDGWTENNVAALAALEYLEPLKEKNIDTLILGCTHYPVLKNVIRSIMGMKVNLIDSGKETAKEVKKLLESKRLLNPKKKPGSHKFFVTDFQKKFSEISERFLGQELKNVKKVRL
jgi:glutamate racemase